MKAKLLGLMLFAAFAHAQTTTYDIDVSMKGIYWAAPPLVFQGNFTFNGSPGQDTISNVSVSDGSVPSPSTFTTGKVSGDTVTLFDWEGEHSAPVTLTFTTSRPLGSRGPIDLTSFDVASVQGSATTCGEVSYGQLTVCREKIREVHKTPELDASTAVGEITLAVGPFLSRQGTPRCDMIATDVMQQHLKELVAPAIWPPSLGHPRSDALR